MSSKGNSHGITRRKMIGTASLATLGATMLTAAEAGAAPQQNYQVGKDPGKHEPLEDFKFDVEATTGWVGEAGSAKEATVEEFPVSKSIAGVSMRLKPGGIRELHWHAIAAEWAYVIEGKVMGTVIAPNGEPATDIFLPGDLWYFPRGHGHALQNIGNTEAHFIIGFDDGHFSEYGTFSITDWVSKTSPKVAARNLGVSEQVIAQMPKKEAYIIQGKIPSNIPEGYLAEDLQENQNPHKFRLGQAKLERFEYGWIRRATQKEFPINATLTSVLQEINPGGVREMHWHPNADEWQYVLSGRGRMTVFGAHGRVKSAEYGPG